MKKLIVTSLLLSGLAVSAMAQTYTQFATREATPVGFSEEIVIFGSPGARTTLVEGFSKCTQTEGTLVLCPWSLGYTSIFANYINFVASGTVESGHSSVTVTVYGEKALIVDGDAGWDGWYQDDHLNNSIRKLWWKLYDLPVQPNDN